jgi:hypothetical protein
MAAKNRLNLRFPTIPATNPLNLQFEHHWPQDCDEERRLFAILAPYLPHDSKVSATRAAEEIHSLFLAELEDEEDIEEGWNAFGLLETYWDSMFVHVQQLDYDGIPMQRFLDLIEALSGLPGEIVHDADEDEGRTFRWEDLPGFSTCLTERWHRKSHHHKRRGVTSGKSRGLLKFLMAEVDWHPPSPEDIRRFKNISGFRALLALEWDNDLYVCISVLSWALERNEKGSVAESTLAGLVPAAAFWFTQCRARIDRACEARECQNSAGGELWKGSPGFSPERRRFWIERFEEIALRGDVEESTKSACRAAIQSGFQINL